MATLRKEIKRAPYIAESAAFYREYEWGLCESQVEPLLDLLDYWLEDLEDAEGWAPPLLDHEVEWLEAVRNVCTGLVMALDGFVTIAATVAEVPSCPPDPTVVQ